MIIDNIDVFLTQKTFAKDDFMVIWRTQSVLHKLYLGTFDFTFSHYSELPISKLIQCILNC